LEFDASARKTNVFGNRGTGFHTARDIGTNEQHGVTIRRVINGRRDSAEEQELNQIYAVF